MGGNRARVLGHEAAMASMGTTIPGTWSTTPTVLRVGGTRVAVPTGCCGGTTKGPPSAHARRSDWGPFGDGTHSRPDRAKILLAGMRADVSRVCIECDCAMFKTRRGRREPLHQYIVGVPMEQLAMDVAGLYPITSSGTSTV